MVNYFIYAKDFSGSTGGVEHYHKNGLKTLEQFKNDVEKMEQELLIAGEPPTKSKILYLHWGSSCWEVCEEATRTAYTYLTCGWMGTEPQTIIEYIRSVYNAEEDNIRLLYIITDGLIGSYSAEVCFKLNESMNYEMVVFHAINEDPQRIDLSVAASFFKSRCMVYQNNERYDDTDISKEFDYDNINIDNFSVEKEQLKSYIRLKYINSSQRNANALREIDYLKKLRDRLFHELSSKNEKNRHYEINLETKDKHVFLSEFIQTDWYKNLTATAYTEKVDIEKYITTLINYIVSDAKSYSFDALKFSQKFNKPVEEEEIIDVNFAPEQEIEFPDIILDDDKGIPVVIVTTCNLMDKIIFHGITRSEQVTPASFSKFKSTMDCPLFLVNDRDVSESIGYFYTLNVYKQFLANGMRAEPRTRRPFQGGIVLTDTNDFDKYNDYILSSTFFDGKKVSYNVGLFYFVLWKNCENKEWMDRNVVSQFKNYTMRRISETRCKIGLSSLPLDLSDYTSLPTALWYCVELSSYIFKNDPLFFTHERIRGYYRVAQHMIEILKFFNYDLDLESIEKRRELFSYVMTLKRIQNRRDKVYYLLERIFKSVNGFLVSEIKKPSNLYKLNYLKFNHKDMLGDDILEEKVHLNDYVHLMHIGGDLEASKAGTNTQEICEKTFRPHFVIDQSNSFYAELIKNSRKVVINNDSDIDKIEITYEAVDSLEFDRVLSLYKLFINYVQESEKYPSLPEYTEYVLRKKKFYEVLVIIFPPSINYDIKNVYERYQSVANKVEVTEFIKVCKAYVGRTERIKAENRLKFINDSKISIFIASEEDKVKLKKKNN